ncbi:hypothetical protein BAY61_31785 (plasmid) [Prauserella marina]|uniref:Uncharacterized protein n=1 Tax=Prauserella marina TaxID=530584 RepID=A0A222W109_9PSEU|nr:hypothetical protein [Prauserella marina]ASR39869.1 hypothetical protein BAY61_31785 [Prauserella marina]PWV71361.1 hypothetical protein DES30_11277 [Prauserella marina]SDD95801.1 hypothetical protein SAMN05421630_11535 [Prauserella marina]
MANKILFDENPDGQFPSTLDRTEGRRYSVLGPMDNKGKTDPNGHYKAWITRRQRSWIREAGTRC